MLKILFLVLLFSFPAIANVSCESTFAELLNVSKMFHKKNKQLFKQDYVQISKTKDTKNEPAHLIAHWFQVLEKKTSKYEKNLSLEKKVFDYYFDRHIVKDQDIPEGYYKNQQRLARERGHGNIELNTGQRRELAKIAIEDQKASLKQWLEYLLSSHTKHYPIWVKYWVFNSMVKLGKFDSETGTFSNRSKGQISPFPELNREALTYVIEAFIKKTRNQNLKDITPEFLKLTQGANFGKMYGYQLQQAHVKALELAHLQKNVEGKWVKFNHGSDHIPLVESLRGRNTGWCTAGEATAKSQLAHGDFYVFYSLDGNKKAKVPRLAIRMQGNKISEVRGVGKDQNLDSIIAGTDVLKSKLEEFGEEGHTYLKKDNDMKSLTRIEKAVKDNKELSIADLIFLYELESPIEGFGFQKDPRVEEIVETRNIRADISKALQVPEKNISLEAKYNPLKENELDKVIAGQSLVHYGNLNLTELSNLNESILPKRVTGYYFQTRNTFKNKKLNLPEGVKNLVFSEAGDISNFHFVSSLETVRLSGVTSGRNLSFSDSIKEISTNDFIGLEQIRWPKNLVHLSIEGKRYNTPINVPEGLQRLNVWGDLDANGLVLPNSLTGLQVINLTRFENVQLSNSLSELHADNVISAVGIKLPKSLEYVNFRKLESAEGVDFTELDGAHINLRSLRTKKGLVLPKGKVSITLNKVFYQQNKDFFDRPGIKIHEVEEMTRN